MQESVTNPSQFLLLYRRTRAVVCLACRSFYVFLRKVIPSARVCWRDRFLPAEATPSALLRGFLSDLRTALYRIGRRVDTLPALYTLDAGPCYEHDATGNFQPNTRTLGCISDMQHSESLFPTATDFDWEMFRIGWNMGAKWGEDRCAERAQQ